MSKQLFVYPMGLTKKWQHHQQQQYQKNINQQQQDINQFELEFKSLFNKVSGFQPAAFLKKSL